MNTNKTGVIHLVDLCAAHGVRFAVISPGSRNAPITRAFLQHQELTCHSIVDERSAGFVALGMAQQLQSPVALVCTSGSAVLNYAPAVVEAFYQGIPLVIISADRPEAWIDQGIGQSIRQPGALKNFVKKEVSLPGKLADNPEEMLWYNNRLINEALLACKKEIPGPVHINVPLSEPLYKTEFSTSESSNAKVIQTITPETQSITLPEIDSYTNILILIGQQAKQEELTSVLKELSKLNTIQIWTECTANSYHPNFCNGIDKLLMSLNENDRQNFTPDLIISTHGAIVSKKVKRFLQESNAHHWLIHPEGTIKDTFAKLRLVVKSDPLTVFHSLLNTIKGQQKNSSYQLLLKSRINAIENLHESYLKKAPFSDFLVFGHLFKFLRKKSINLHLANSATVRYAQLFEPAQQIHYFSNRGTSGIDGSSSTAVGAAMVSDKTNWLISGDISFLYDSNAFWNTNLPNNLKIVVINNSGGGIFRIIDGPEINDDFEQFMETTHNHSAINLCKQFHVKYLSADNEEQLKDGLEQLSAFDGICLLEVFTPREKNADVLNNYFNTLKSYHYE